MSVLEREGSFSSIKREFSTLSNDQTPDRSPVSLVGNQRVERSWISPGNKSNKALFPKKFYLSLLPFAEKLCAHAGYSALVVR